MSEIPKKTVKRIISQEGAQRVSGDSSKALTAFLETIAREIAEIAIILSHHAGRETVKEEDIQRGLDIMLSQKRNLEVNLQNEA